MRTRFEKITDGRFPSVTFGTFHSCFLEILRRSSPSPIRLIDSGGQNSLIHHIVFTHKDLLTSDPENCIAAAAGSIALIKTRSAETLQADPLYLSSLRFFRSENSVRRIASEYDFFLRENGLIDFEDMILRCRELLESDRSVRERWQERFRYFLVDEFQDISPQQYETVKLLAGDGKRTEGGRNLFVVGDDDQSIYGFRGASPGVLRNFLEDYPDAAVIRLSVNYRCSGPIVRAAGLVIQQNRDRFPKKISAFRGEGEPVKSLCCTDEAEEYGVILERLKRIPEEELKNTAVIFRNHFQAGNFTDFLKFHSFPVTEPGEKPAPEALAVRDVVLSYLRAASGMEGSASGECTRADFYRIMNCPMRYFVRACAGSERVSIDSLCTYYRSNPTMLETIRLLERDFRLLLHLGPPLAVRYIRKTLRAEEGLLEGTSEKVRERIHRAFDALEQKASGFRTQEDFIRFLSGNEDIGKTAPAEDGDSTDSHSVQVLTMHASKGLEFGSVFLPDLNEGILPGRQSITPTSVEEERRLFYVAMTRAKNSLYLSYTCGTKANPRRPSRFLRPLGIKD